MLCRDKLEVIHIKPKTFYCKTIVMEILDHVSNLFRKKLSRESQECRCPIQCIRKFSTVQLKLEDRQFPKSQ